ncbi:MAG: hypothetical protein JXB32_10575 [Deltaproteobacteria bacterium]|nr:hypothetical protein [Deltaproteobacteria bacterium]
MSRLRAGFALFGTLLVLTAGCDELGLAGERTDAHRGDLRTLGVVTFQSVGMVDLQAPGDVSGSGERFVVEARFVRYPQPLESEVREVLGLAELDGLPPADTCAVRARPAGPVLEPAARGAEIELLDVGRILARGGGTEHALPVRTFPDLLDVMSGVTYGGVSALPYIPGRRYDVRGESDRSPWVSVDAPPAWEDLRINGLAVGEGLFGTFDTEPQLEANWIPWTDRPSDVVLSLSWTGADGSRRALVCHPADDGVFQLPADAVAQLPAAPELADLTLRLERVVRVSFPLDRLDEAEAVFRVSLTTPVR